MKINSSQTIEVLTDCIERLMELLRKTVAKDEAEAIYEEFFGGDADGKTQTS